MSDDNKTTPHEPITVSHEPPTIPAVPPELDVLPGHGVQRPTPRSSRMRKKRARRTLIGCFQWIRTMLSVLLMALAALIGTVVIVGLVIYNSLAGELAEDITALDSMQGVENFQSTRIYDRDGLAHPYMTTGKTIALTRRTFVG